VISKNGFFDNKQHMTGGPVGKEHSAAKPQPKERGVYAASLCDKPARPEHDEPHSG
jgi:hypothetical protein